MQGDNAAHFLADVARAFDVYQPRAALRDAMTDNEHPRLRASGCGDRSQRSLDDGQTQSSHGRVNGVTSTIMRVAIPRRVLRRY